MIPLSNNNQPNKRSRKTKNLYFTKLHEEAILDYVRTDSKSVRENLYNKLIAPAFDEMVEKIVLTYRFNKLPNIDILKQECKVFLVTILNKFDVKRGYKAFSYFSVISKNFFIQQTKKKSKRMKEEVSYENLSIEDQNAFFSVENPYNRKREKSEFNNFFLKEMEDWKYEYDSSTTEGKVLWAINYLYENADKIEIFNKKAIYFNIRELTDLNTKQIVQVLKKLKICYIDFRQDWNNGDI